MTQPKRIKPNRQSQPDSRGEQSDAVALPSDIDTARTPQYIPTLTPVNPDWTRILAPPAANTAATGESPSWNEPVRSIGTRSGSLGPGSIIKDRFVLEEQIGRGGMGVVFKARDLRKVEAEDPDPYVAIKILNEELRGNRVALLALQREARRIQGVAHPNIVTVYDFDRDGTNVYLVMELLEGEPLDRVIMSNAAVGLGAKEALRITHDLCLAMAHAHERGIVHADFKPSNVFLTRSGVVKIFDFGLARAGKRSDPVGGRNAVFAEEMLSGFTPTYASCEVIEGQPPEVRDDIYSIACVIYELLTGVHPFNRVAGNQARDAGSVASAPAGLSRRQWQALQRALAFQRAQRPASVTQFVDELRPQRRSPVRYIGAAAACVTLIVAAIFAVHAMVSRDSTVDGVLADGDSSQTEQAPFQLREVAPARRAETDAERFEVPSQVQPVSSTQPDVSAAENAAESVSEGSRGPGRTATKLGSGLPATARLPSRVWPTGSAAPPSVGSAEPQQDLAVTYRQLDASLASAAAVTEIVAENIPVSAGIALQQPARAEPATKVQDVAVTTDSLKQTLLTQAEANNVTDALATRAKLRALLPANDSFLTTQAPQSIAKAYLRVALLAAKEGRFVDALSLAESGREIAPGLREIDAARDRYASYRDIDAQLTERDRIHLLQVHHIRFKISRLAKQEPDEMAAVTQSLARRLAARIDSTKDPELAAHLSSAGRRIFTDSPLFQAAGQRLAVNPELAISQSQ